MSKVFRLSFVFILQLEVPFIAARVRKDASADSDEGIDNVDAN